MKLMFSELRSHLLLLWGCVNSSVWLFGMKQRGANRFIILPLKNRKEETLIPIIKRHVKRGSTLYSDSFSVYVNNRQKVSKLMPHSFVHYFINHSIEFVSQVSNEIHTNSIESLWSQVKKELKRNKVTSKYMLTVGRYYFYKILDASQQISLLCKALNKIEH